MLILGRMVGEEIIVTFPDGRTGRVVLVELWQGDPPRRAKIGFDFPPDVKLVRKELLTRAEKDHPPELDDLIDDPIERIEKRHESPQD